MAHVLLTVRRRPFRGLWPSRDIGAVLTNFFHDGTERDLRTLIAYLMGLTVVHGGPAFARVEQELSGAEVYAQSCAMCHSKGTGGAPRPHEIEQWRDRLVSGRANLLRAVLRGKGGMPPKGGNASLSVREAHDALDFMLPGRVGVPRNPHLE